MRSPIAPGTYWDDEKRIFLARPQLTSGKWTWRKLQAVSKRAAVKEGSEKLTMHRRYLAGLEDSSPFEAERKMPFSELSEAYVKAGCPSRNGQARTQAFVEAEVWRLETINQLIGHAPVDSINLPALLDYRDRRLRLCDGVRGPGARTVELDWSTISNVLSFATLKGWLPHNPIKTGRPRLRSNDKVRHCREVSIETGDQLHALANLLLDDRKSEVFGWMTLFAAMFGLRRSELLPLRLDAKSTDEPGYVEGNHLFLRRSKKGINPWFELTDDHLELLAGHRSWHANRFKGKTPWFFPGRDPRLPVAIHSFTHAIRRAATALNMGIVTPHGLRSFYVTKRRGDGAGDMQIAAEIGDTSWPLMATTYGGAPQNWTGRPRPSFRPSSDSPAWVR